MVVIYVLVLKDVIFRRHIYHTLSGDQVLRKQCGGGGNKFGRFWYLRRNGIITWSYHSQYHSHIFQYYVVTVPPINVWVLSTYSLWVPRECPVCSTAARRDVRGEGKVFGVPLLVEPQWREKDQRREEKRREGCLRHAGIVRLPRTVVDRGGGWERETYKGPNRNPLCICGPERQWEGKERGAPLQDETKHHGTSFSNRVPRSREKKRNPPHQHPTTTPRTKGKKK